MLTTTTSWVDSYLQYERELGQSVATIHAYRNALAQLEKSVKTEDLREVTTEDLVAFTRDVQARVGRGTAYLYIRTVKRFFKFLAEDHKLLVDPAEQIPLPKLHQSLVGPILSHEEIERLVVVCDVSDPRGVRDRAILEFLYSTALRVSELARIKVTDLDPVQGMALVRGGKGAKDRVVPVGKIAREWVERYLKEARPRFAKFRPETEELFISYRGSPFSLVVLNMHLKRLGRAAKLPINFTCHVMRRTVATELLRNGATPHQVAGILGHEDLRSLTRYIAFAAREVKEAHAKNHPREKEQNDE